MRGFILLKERPVRHEAFELRESATSKGRGDGVPLRAIFLVYFLFGFAYIIYVTYIDWSLLSMASVSFWERLLEDI
jgi:hypothetical protein